MPSESGDCIAGSARVNVQCLGFDTWPRNLQITLAKRWFGAQNAILAQNADFEVPRLIFLGFRSSGLPFPLHLPFPPLASALAPAPAPYPAPAPVSNPDINRPGRTAQT